MNTVETSTLRVNASHWPRKEVNWERVELFSSIYQEGTELPPIEIVARVDGTYLVADGVHRSYAAAKAGRTSIDAILRTPDVGESNEAFVFRRGLETATNTALPLTSGERKAAAMRLIEEHTEMSHREIARRVGVAHNSVDRWANGVDESCTDGGRETSTTPTGDDVARKLVSALVRLDDARGLLDTVAPSRMGKHLAQAYQSRLGNDALVWARRFAQWTASAVGELERQS
jgi:hypothetical protein